MARFFRAPSGSCLIAAGVLLALAGPAAELSAQNALRRGNSGPLLQQAGGDEPQADSVESAVEPGPLRPLTGGEPDPSYKPRSRRWRKAGAGALAGETPDALKARKAPSVGPPSEAETPDEAASPAANAANEPAASEAQPKALPADAAGEPGKSLVMKAYAKSRAAKDEAAFSETIEICRDAVQAGLKPGTATYAHQLMAWAHNRRGELHAAAERDDQAFDDFDAAVELDGNSWRALHNRGVSYAVFGKSAKALADFNRAIEINPDFAIAYFNRGETRYEAGEFETAVADYDVAAKLLPDDAGIFNSRGHAHFRLGHYQQAVADFNRTLKLDPKSAAACLNRGDVYAAMGNYPRAAHDYDASIRLQPNLGRAHQSMAWLLATCPDPKFRNPEQAVIAAKTAIELDGQDDHRYLATLAAAYANAGKFEAAERLQRQAVKWAPPKSRPAQEKRLALYHNHKPYRTVNQEAAPPSTDRQVKSEGRSAPMSTGVRQASGFTR